MIPRLCHNDTALTMRCMIEVAVLLINRDGWQHDVSMSMY